MIKFGLKIDTLIKKHNMSRKKKSNPELISKTKEFDTLKDKYLRLIAEFENYKKRTMKEKEDFSKYAAENIIKSLLPIIDDFERAKKTNEQDIKGYKLIGQKMLDVLSKQNVKKIEIKKNENFDLDKHEAISSVPVKTKKEKGIVLEEVESGYQLIDKIIRYPKVIIGKWVNEIIMIY